MTVQAGIEVETDLELLVGDMPAIPCESTFHGKTENHAGEATHYGRPNHECAGRHFGKIVAVCRPYAERYIAEADLLGTCPDCKKILTGREYFEVLGPINSTTR